MVGFPRAVANNGVMPVPVAMSLPVPVPVLVLVLVLVLVPVALACVHSSPRVGGDMYVRPRRGGPRNGHTGNGAKRHDRDQDSDRLERCGP
jgi:hypothetical protein